MPLPKTNHLCRTATTDGPQEICLANKMTCCSNILGYMKSLSEMSSLPHVLF